MRTISTDDRSRSERRNLEALWLQDMMRSSRIIQPPLKPLILQIHVESLEASGDFGRVSYTMQAGVGGSLLANDQPGVSFE